MATKRNTRTTLLAFAIGVSAAAVAYAAAPVRAATDLASGDPSRHFVLMIVYAAVALVFSFLCSVAEAVLLSVSPSYIANLKATGASGADAVSDVKKNIDRSLAAILTLNTIAHTVGAGGAGAEAAAYFGETYVGVAMAVLTLLILFLSEIIPKTLGALYWRQLAPLSARLVQMLCRLLYPLLLVSDVITKLLARGKPLHAINRDELAAMADVGEASGQLDARESQILKNVFRLSGLRATDVMTPRTVVFALQQDLSVAEVMSQHKKINFSRIPIYAANRDDVTGFVLHTDLLINQHTSDGKAKLRDLSREIVNVPATMPLSRVLEALLKTRSHIVLVLDEYGGLDGVVTLEDVVETLIGIEIVDEGDKIDDMRRLAREKWQQRMERLGIDTGTFEP